MGRRGTFSSKYFVILIAVWWNVHMGAESQEIECTPLKAPVNGSVTFDSQDNLHVAYLTCDEGYKISGASKRRCINGIWTGLETECYETIDPDLEMSLIIGAACAGGVALLSLFSYIVYRSCFRSNDQKDHEAGSKQKAGNKYEINEVIIDDEGRSGQN